MKLAEVLLEFVEIRGYLQAIGWTIIEIPINN